MEWKPGGASTGAAHSDWSNPFHPGRVPDEELERTAQLFATELSGQLLQDVSVEKLADTEKPTEGDIVLDFRKAVGDGKEWTQTLGNEGYELNLEAESPA